MGLKVIARKNGNYDVVSVLIDEVILRDASEDAVVSLFVERAKRDARLQAQKAIHIACLHKKKFS